MNVFIIPSWYPSKDQPFAGIFNKEQAEALSHLYPNDRFAVSSWGSHDEDLLIWKKDHILNLIKLLKFFSKTSHTKSLSPNLLEYYSPAFTWSRKIFRGNIKAIIRVNEQHFLDFQRRAGKIDIIHAHSAYPGGWVAMKLSQKYKIPYIITEHMSPFPFPDFLLSGNALSPYLSTPFAHSFCNIVVSPQQKETLEKWNIPRLKYIPNLVNDHFFRPKGAPEKEKKTFTFFTLASLVPQKGIPFLLEAAKMITEENKQVRFRIGDTGPMEQEYKALATELSLDDFVAWLGPLNRAKTLEEYQDCDAFVLPSLHENLPLVLLEAIACGKPIISTRCGGPESIINSTNGILIEPGNTSALHMALQNMVDNVEQYSPGKIRADFCQRYSMEVIGRQIMAVYMEAIAPGKSRQDQG